jgi:uncharacterized coiled-coil DUF342 family protein
MNNSHENEPISTTRLREALHRVVLLRETGPKSAAWHRARVQTIWRLHTMLAEQREQAEAPAPHHPDSSNPSSG